MPPLQRAASDQLGLLEARLPTAPCVPAIREAVSGWRAARYPSISDTTGILLNYWFLTVHRPLGRPFTYHDSQREAIEALIYLYEVEKIQRHKDLLEASPKTRKTCTCLSTTTLPAAASQWRPAAARQK